jgi:hypothetical protein
VKSWIEDWEERQNRIRDDVDRGEERMDDVVDDEGDDGDEGRGVLQSLWDLVSWISVFLLGITLNPLM